MEKQCCILVIDDEPAVRRVAELALETAGYKVVQAESGVRGLAMLDEFEFDLVILDILMPGLGGFEVLKEIRRRSDVPVIMLTARCEATAVRDSLGLGADDYIRKPFSTVELLARVKAKMRRCQPVFPSGSRRER